MGRPAALPGTQEAVGSRPPPALPRVDADREHQRRGGLHRLAPAVRRRAPITGDNDMKQIQWTNHHNRQTTTCVLVNTHDWRSMAYELRTGDHVSTMTREPTPADYRAHLREAGINPRGLQLPVQMQRPQTTDARMCASCQGWYPKVQMVRVRQRGNLVCLGCAEKKRAAQ